MGLEGWNTAREFQNVFRIDLGIGKDRSTLPNIGNPPMSLLWEFLSVMMDLKPSMLSPILLAHILIVGFNLSQSRHLGDEHDGTRKS